MGYGIWEGHGGWEGYGGWEGHGGWRGMEEGRDIEDRKFLTSHFALSILTTPEFDNILILSLSHSLIFRKPSCDPLCVLSAHFGDTWGGSLKNKLVFNLLEDKSH